MKTPWRIFYEWYNRNWWQIGFVYTIILIALLAFIFTSCGGQPRPLPDAPAESAGATLRSVGATLVWTGGISAAAGFALRIVSLVYPPLGAFGAFFGFIGLGGLAVTGTGSSLQWLSDNPIVCILAILASVGVVVWWYWPRIRRALDRRLDQK